MFHEFLLSIKRNPFIAKNQTVRSYQRVHFAYWVGIISFYPELRA